MNKESIYKPLQQFKKNLEAEVEKMQQLWIDDMSEEGIAWPDRLWALQTVLKAIPEALTEGEDEWHLCTCNDDNCCDCHRTLGIGNEVPCDKCKKKPTPRQEQCKNCHDKPNQYFMLWGKPCFRCKLRQEQCESCKLLGCKTCGGKGTCDHNQAFGPQHLPIECKPPAPEKCEQPSHRVLNPPTKVGCADAAPDEMPEHTKELCLECGWYHEKVDKCPFTKPPAPAEQVEYRHDNNSCKYNDCYYVPGIEKYRKCYKPTLDLSEECLGEDVGSTEELKASQEQCQHSYTLDSALCHNCKQWCKHERTSKEDPSCKFCYLQVVPTLDLPEGSTCHDIDHCHPTSEPCEKCPKASQECECVCHQELGAKRIPTIINCPHCKPAAPTSFWEAFDEEFYEVNLGGFKRKDIKDWLKRELKPLLEGLRMEEEPCRKEDGEHCGTPGWHGAVKVFHAKLTELEKEIL